ncbi:MAG: peptide ABC transporter substrate-binding protein [Aliidongia sp.]
MKQRANLGGIGRWALGALIVILVLGAARAEPSVRQRDDDELVIGVPGSVTSVHPLLFTISQGFVLGFAHRWLVMPDQSWHLVCMLCTELPSLENGRVQLVTAPDGGRSMEVFYTLQPEARWADGEPVTSQDVTFSAEVAKLPDIGLPNAALLRDLRGVRIIDPKNFVLLYDHYDVNLNASNAFQILPEHIEGPIYRKLANKRDYLKHSAYRTIPTEPGLWMGPYRLTGFRAGRYAMLERNPFWFGPRPFFRKITLRFYPSSAQAQAGFFAGETDFLQEGTLTPATAADVRAEQSDRFSVKSAPGSTLLMVDINVDHPQLGDVRIRRALLQAIDRKSIAMELLGDDRTVATSFLAPRDPGYNAAVPQVTFDPAAASRNLLDAGYRQDESGRWLDGQGNPLAFRLSTNPANSLTGPVGDRLAAAWRRLGADVTVVADPLLVTQTLQHRGFDVALFSRIAIPLYVPRTILESSAIPTPANNFSGRNFSGLKSAAIDKTLAALTGETDDLKRQARWSQLQIEWMDELPGLPLFDLPQLYIVPNWLEGFAPTGHLIASSHFCETWRRKP